MFFRRIFAKIGQKRISRPGTTGIKPVRRYALVAEADVHEYDQLFEGPGSGRPTSG
jgi:hypothetical protein